jgi:NitT/TauT family transport system substrate-binding protein
MIMRQTFVALMALVLAWTAQPVAKARAEVSEVTFAQQFGIAFLPIMVLENQKLVEKHAAAKGAGDVKGSFIKVAGPSVMVDAMLSGSLHFAAQGPPSLALLWDKTKGGVRGVGGLCTYNLWLNTRNPDVKTVKDFTDKDRIAVPSVKASTQAILLQMLAEKEFGADQKFKYDPMTIGLGHPDAMAQLLNPTSAVNAHFASSPFHETEIKVPGMRTLTTAFDINGGQSSQLVFTTTEKFRTENPKVYAVVVAAIDDAIAWINADKKRAAALYLSMSGDKKTSEEDILSMMNSPGFEYTRTPMKVGKLFDFMARIGSIKTKPTSWKDLFFAEAHGLPGD